MIYIIKDVKDGLNYVYVTKREDAIRICSELPGMFTWEPLKECTHEEINGQD